MRIGAPDGRLNPATGFEAVREAERILGATATQDAGIVPVKERASGLSGGEQVVAMVSAQLAGEDFFVDRDRRRADTAGQELELVPTPASTTEAGTSQRFGKDQLRGIETGIGTVNKVMASLLPLVRRPSLKVATIDGDTTDAEVCRCSRERNMPSPGH